jgi:hypothetical protein
VAEPNIDLLRALLPDPGTDVTPLFRDEDWFATTAEAVAELFDPAVESVPAWRGAGATYSGIDGFREMWLDWLEPWATYHVQVDEMFTWATASSCSFAIVLAATGWTSRSS